MIAFIEEFWYKNEHSKTQGMADFLRLFRGHPGSNGYIFSYKRLHKSCFYIWCMNIQNAFSLVIFLDCF